MLQTIMLQKPMNCVPSIRLQAAATGYHLLMWYCVALVTEETSTFISWRSLKDVMWDFVQHQLNNVGLMNMSTVRLYFSL